MRSVLSKLSVLCLLLWAGCTGKEQQVDKGPEVVHRSEGTVVLEDKQFGLFYGDRYGSGQSVFYLVLSDARCYTDGLTEPYMDSDGDMLVLELYAPGGNESLPDGVYECSETGTMRFSPGSSYVVKFDGNTQTRWEICGGKIHLAKDADGIYDIYTEGLVIKKSSELLEVSYKANTALLFKDYMQIAPGLVGTDDDIIDMPFYDVECDYYGNLYETGTGNYLLSLSTKGFLEDETGHCPGVLLVMNCFSTLYSSKVNPVLAAGEYPITMTGFFQLSTMLPGMDMEGQPFGTYFYQQPADSDGVLEYASSGSLSVSYNDEICTLSFDIVTTSSRKLSGTWTGKLEINNLAESDDKVILSTLVEDVECDMSKIEKGYLRRIEVLHRNNVTPEKDYDIAEAWQLKLMPRDWTQEERELYDWDERLEHWAPDGDSMFLEFILPLQSKGLIAPVIGKEYVYTMQPALENDDPRYSICVSKNGRPYDELFDPVSGAEYGYDAFMDYSDRVNARRGFMWSGDFRGNWYIQYIEGQYFMMDNHAPGIHGKVTVVRTSESEYDIKWELEDDAEVPNKITGEWSGPVTIYN